MYIGVKIYAWWSFEFTSITVILVSFKVVNLQFEGGATVNFTMVAYTEKVCARQVRIFGTKVSKN